MNKPLTRQGPKPKGCPVLLLKISAVAVLLIWLVTS